MEIKDYLIIGSWIALVSGLLIIGYILKLYERINFNVLSSIFTNTIKPIFSSILNVLKELVQILKTVFTS